LAATDKEAIKKDRPFMRLVQTGIETTCRCPT